jgi:hypothetical protein
MAVGVLTLYCVADILQLRSVHSLLANDLTIARKQTSPDLCMGIQKLREHKDRSGRRCLVTLYRAFAL